MLSRGIRIQAIPKYNLMGLEHIYFVLKHSRKNLKFLSKIPFILDAWIGIGKKPIVLCRAAVPRPLGGYIADLDNVYNTTVTGPPWPSPPYNGPSEEPPKPSKPRFSLDKIDVGILSVLSIDACSPISTISSMLKIPVTKVRYHYSHHAKYAILERFIIDIPEENIIESLAFISTKKPFRTLEHLSQLTYIRSVSAGNEVLVLYMKLDSLRLWESTKKLIHMYGGDIEMFLLGEKIKENTIPWLLYRGKEWSIGGLELT